MKTIAVTLAADGSSDRCLIHPLRWAITQALRNHGARELIRFVFAQVPANPLPQRIQKAVEDYPCDILIVHRDAEREDASRRFQEIEKALADAAATTVSVGVVPIRMSEAWLLISEPAIRTAAANPSGRTPLNLPPISALESLPDPKGVLRNAILDASNANGRRRDRLKRDLPIRVQRVAENIEDYSLLRELTAFKRFEKDFERAIAQLK